VGDVEPKVGSSIHWNRKQPLCAHGSTERGTVLLSGREGHWKQFYTKCSLINVPHTPSGLSWICKATNTMTIKADPAICSFVNSVYWISVLELLFVWFSQIQPHI